MKKLALAITGVGMACVTGLGLAQPASAITGYINCEGWYLQEHCDLVADFSSQEVWSLNGTVVSAWNDQTYVQFNCGSAGTTWKLDVTYLDGSGVSQTNHRSGFCTSSAPM